MPDRYVGRSPTTLRSPLPSVARSFVRSFVGLGSIDSNLTRYLSAIRKNWGTEGRRFGRQRDGRGIGTLYMRASGKWGTSRLWKGVEVVKNTSESGKGHRDVVVKYEARSLRHASSAMPAHAAPPTWPLSQRETEGRRNVKNNIRVRETDGEEG